MIDKMKRLVSILLFLCVVSCHQKVMVDPITNNASMQQDIEKTWVRFIEAISDNNLNKLRLVATQKIRCFSCVDNTEQESKELQKFTETDPDWYNKLYDQKIFIPLDKFFNEDVPIIFNKDLMGKVKTGKVNYVERSIGKESFYEIIVATIEPGEFAPLDEGVLHVFLFVKTADGYKFTGIDTIP